MFNFIIPYIYPTGIYRNLLIIVQEKWMVNSGMHFVHPVEIIAMEDETDDDGTEIPFNVSFLTLLAHLLIIDKHSESDYDYD